MALDTPKLKPFIKAVKELVQADGIDPNFILPHENKETVRDDAVREIVSNVSEFENWYFVPTPDDLGLIDSDPRRDRIAALPKNLNLEANLLVSLVKEIVESNLQELRDFDELPAEPDVDDLIKSLTSYIVNWQNWYYDYKTQQDQLDWYIDAGLNAELYNGKYGDRTEAVGSSNLFDESTKPYSDVEADISETL